MSSISRSNLPDFVCLSVKDAVAELQKNTNLTDRDMLEMTNQVFDAFMDRDSLDLIPNLQLNASMLPDAQFDMKDSLQIAFNDYREMLRQHLVQIGMQAAIDTERSFNFHVERLVPETGKLIVKHLKS